MKPFWRGVSVVSMCIGLHVVVESGWSPWWVAIYALAMGAALACALMTTLDDR